MNAVLAGLKQEVERRQKSHEESLEGVETGTSSVRTHGPSRWLRGQLSVGLHGLRFSPDDNDIARIFEDYL